MARMILIAIGSAGDVHPILAIARELSRRNHEVIVLTNPSFEPLVSRLGFDFRPLGTREEFDEVADNPDVWHPVRGFRLLARWAMLHTMKPIYELLEELYLPQKTVVAAPLTALTSAAVASRYRCICESPSRSFKSHGDSISAKPCESSVGGSASLRASATGTGRMSSSSCSVPTSCSKTCELGQMGLMSGQMAGSIVRPLW